jgi:outer membrane protein
MNNKYTNSFFRIIVVAGCILTGIHLNARTQEAGNMAIENDTLALEQIMNEVIQNYPAIKKAEEALNIASAGLGLAKSGYYPDVDASVNVSHVGPVPELTVPNLGSFQLFPDNNFDGGLNIRQNIYDFGKTSSNVAYANGNKELLEKALDETRQNVAISVIKNYYTLVYLQQAIKIKDSQLATLNEHLDYVKKKKATGSATDYEILSTQVKISAVESQKLDLEAARDKQLAFLNSLLGLPAGTFHLVNETLAVSKPDIPGDSLINYALQHRKEMQIALKKNELALLHLNVVKTQNNPSLNFIANGGWKNGYVPDIEKIQAHYLVGLGLRVPIFDGTRSKYNIMMAKSSAESSKMESEIIQRNISSEVVENVTNLETASKKVDQSKLQLSQAQEAYKLARINYSAGVITNLDLLDAATAVSESNLMVLKAEIDYTISLYLLESSVGKQLY